MGPPDPDAPDGVAAALAGRNLYFGNLLPDERQFAAGDFVGLALDPLYPKDVAHDLYDPLPVADCSVARIQAQDVFEHLQYERLPAILDDIYRALAPGGVFRLSVPDYRSPLLVARSVFDENGEVIADVMMGGSVRYNPATGRREAGFAPGGGSHIWFPTYDKVQALILRSQIRHCARIVFYHYFATRTAYVADPLPDDEMPVTRAPPRDMRAGGAPISIIADFVK
ncbi:MAG: hypothetical protein U1F24_16485 [Alphaproteobacteria bacterium]